MPDRNARLAVLLGLIPAIVGLIFALMNAHSALAPVLQLLAPPVKSHEQFTLLAASVTAAIAVVLLWRRYVEWTPARSAATVAWTALLLGQILLWTPMTAVQGCGRSDVLLAGQSSTMGGLWCIGCALTWWSIAFRRRGRSRPPRSAGGKRMTTDVARIACGMAMFPLLMGLLWICSVLLSEWGMPGAHPWPECIATEIISLVAVFFWFLLWRSRVQWTRYRSIMTFVLALALLVAPAQWLLPDDGVFLRVVKFSTWFFAAALWLIGTAWLWRSPQELEIRSGALSEICCPNCNYCLTGLREIRCPECNWSSTIDEIARIALESAGSG